MLKIKDIIQDIDLKKASVGTVPYIEIGDIDINTKEILEKQKPSVSGAVIAPSNSVLISKVRPTRGAITLLRSEQVVSNAFAILIPKEGVCDIEYLFYILAWNNDFLSYLGSRATGATYPTVKLKEILEYEISNLPKISEQKEIVKTLKEAERLKKQRFEADQKMSELIPSVFDKMFGSSLQNEQGWEKGKLTKYFDFVGGGTPSKSNQLFWNGEIPWVSPKDMKNDYISDSQDHITYDAIEKSATNIIPANSILIVTRSGILQHTLPIAINEKELTINQDLKSLINLDPKKVNTLFMYTQLKTRKEEILKMVKTGVTVQSLNTEDLKNLQVIVPPIEKQDEFADKVNEILVFSAKQRESSGLIDDLFSSILSKNV